jgi:hypothetical protein
MITKQMVLVAQNDFRHLKQETIDLLSEMCCFKRGTYTGNKCDNPNGQVNEMLINEGKREVYLTIDTFRSLTTEELLNHFKQGEEE